MRRIGTGLLLLIALLGSGLLPAGAAPDPHRDAGPDATGQLLRPDTGLYPRAIRLQHSGDADGRIMAGVVTFGAQGIGAIYESTDEGATFSQVGTVTDPDAATGLCCATLYELPRQVGALPAGTLLWAASIGQDQARPARRMQIDAWASTDHGRTWSRLATIATAQNDWGLWEPEFTVTPDGRLVCLFSDETESPAHSQALVESVSSDGQNWSERANVVALDDSSARPGMPVVRNLPDGTYFMSYEICGGSFGCTAHYRTSTDALSWGAVTDPGTAITTADGHRFAHAPTIAVRADGALLLVGQVLQDSTGATAPGNGATIMLNTNGGAGPWTTAPAPVSVPGAYDNYCPNYSSTLLPTSGDGSLLEIATDYAADGACKAYYASAPMP